MRFLFALISSVALLAQSQTPPDARQFLIRSGGPALTTEAVRLEGTEKSEPVVPSGRPPMESSFSLFRSGSRMRVEVKAGNTTGLQISDGATDWMYDSASGTYIQLPTARNPVANLFSRLKLARDPNIFSDAQIDREERLEFGGKSVPCYVVRAAYTSMPGNPAAREVVRTVWISQANDLVLRDIWEFSINVPAPLSHGRNRVTTDYTSIEWGMPLADDLFIFHPPQGSHPTPTGPPAVSPPLSSGTTLAGHSAVLRKVQPEYSAEARAAGLQGTVSLYTEIGTDGKPGNIQVLQGLALGLDEKAVEAVKQWEFKPDRTRPGNLQDAREVQVNFSLDSPAPWFVTSLAYWFTLPDRSRLGELRKPVLANYVAPDPRACRTAGSTAISLTVDAQGVPQTVRAVRGEDTSLADAAVEAVQSWQFVPATGSEQAVESQAEVVFACRPGGTPAESDAAPLPVSRVGGGVSAPVLLWKTEPEYSEEARKIRLQGSSLLSIQVSPEGAATEIHVVRMLGMGLDEKAMEAIKRWRFTPGNKDGLPVTVQATIEVNFRLL